MVSKIFTTITLVLITVFLLVLPGICVAATFYVATTGNDSNPGTEARPWKTIQKAANTIVGGDVVIVKDGNYPERVTISRSGLNGAPLRFSSENEHRAVVGTPTGGFTLSGNYIEVIGFNLPTVNAIGNFYSAPVFITGSNNAVYNCRVANPSYHGIFLDRNSRNAHIRGNYIWRPQFGIWISGSNHLVEHNEIDELYPWTNYDTDYVRFFGENHILRSNKLHNSDMGRLNSLGKHVDCFQTYDNGGESFNNVLIEKNFCSDAHQGVMASAALYNNSRDLTIRNNLFINTAIRVDFTPIIAGEIKNVRIYNNTIDGKGSSRSAIRCGTTASCEISNNIIFDMNTHAPYFFDDQAYIIGGIKGAPGRKNLLFSPGRSYSALIYGSDILNLPPLFIDISGNDYRHSNDSPARNAGIIISNWPNPEDIAGNTRPQDGAWDVGAYEFMNNLSIIPPPTGLSVITPSS